MRVPIRRVDPTLPLPEYHSAGAAGFDLYARLDCTVMPGHTDRIPANIVVQVPGDHVLVIALRSSTPRRKGLSSPGGVGVVDSDYCGSDDEVQIQVYNFTADPVEVYRGERIAQAMLLPLVRCEWIEDLPDGAPSRGGFGSTG